MTQVVTQAAVTSRRISVEHVGIPSERLFADVRLTLERVQPKYDARIAAALRSGDQENVKDCEARGPTLSIENEVDHGGLLHIAGGKRNALLYEIGNPLTALKMTRHQLSVGLYLPLRVVLFEDEQGKGVFEFDRPSSLLSQYGDERVTEVGRHVEAVLEAALRKAAE